MQRLRQRHGLLPIACLTDHLDIPLGCQQSADSFPNDFMIIYDKNTNG
jgi:hypothetical protein